MHLITLIRALFTSIATLTPIPIPTPTPVPEPPPPPVAAEPATGVIVSPTVFSGSLTPAGLQTLLECESGSNHAINTGNGFYGGVQWMPATWQAAATQAGYPEWAVVLPHTVPADIQDAVTYYWWDAAGPDQWPVCSRRALVVMATGGG